MFLTHIDATLRQLGEHLLEAFNARTRSFGAVNPTNIVIALVRWAGVIVGA